MKFNCGEDSSKNYARLKNWHEWFAWYPVSVGGHDCRWLEKVQRKGTLMCEYYCDPRWNWEYKAKEKQ